jgi:hypothetical protein
LFVAPESKLINFLLPLRDNRQSVLIRARSNNRYLQTGLENSLILLPWRDRRESALIMARSNNHYLQTGFKNPLILLP